MTKSLLVIIPGFGPPQLPLKQSILQHNLSLIRSTFSGTVKVRLFNYGDISCGSVDVEETFEKGYIGQFLYRHMTPDAVASFDYVMLVLDDIRLSSSFNANHMFHNIDHYKLDILSPALSQGSPYSHHVMLQQKTHVGCIRESAFVEFFCYMMTKQSYTRWYSLLDEKSAWLWGLDFSLFYKQFRMGIYDDIIIDHCILSGGNYGSSTPNPWHELSYTTARHSGNRIVSSMAYLSLMPFLAKN
jgi:hypothetical protein